MRIQRLLVLAVLLSLVSGCYFGITGRVIDAETNQPIEGAVVLVEWTTTHGIGLTHTESYKVAETLSDKNGTFDLPGCYSPFVNPPHLTIYKKGYVAWNNNYIFPNYEKRKDFQWEGDYVFKLEQFKEGVYSHKAHVMFFYNPVASNTKIPKFYEAMGWERAMMRNEIEMQIKH